MKHFRDYLSEEVTIGALASGDINIERDAIRDEINGILAGISARPCVTPYSSLNKIRKALAYFHIHLPKRVYMEGRHGVEVWEIRQFGDKMGMTDQGEFVKTVPCKYYLFFHYHLIGSMYYLEARIVDEDGLEKRLSAVESLVAEEVDAEMRQKVAKGFAPKEPMHDVDAGEEGTKKAVEVSMRRKDKKLSADKLDEVSMGKLVRYRQAADKQSDKDYSETTGWDVADKKKEARIDRREKGHKLAHAKMTGKAKVPASSPKHPYMEETLDETRMPASVIKHKQKLANMTPEEKAKKFAGKTEQQLKDMARRHGYGKDSDVYSKHVKEETLDEISHGLALRAMKKSEKRSNQEYNRDQTYDRLSDYQTHDERAERLRGHMRKKFGNDKPGRGETGGDRLKDRRMSDRLTHGKRAGMPSARHKNDLKSSIKYSLGTHKKANLPEETLDEISTMALKSYKSAAKADRKMSKEVVKKGLDTEGKFKHAAEKRKMGIKLAKKKLDEKLTKGMKVSDVISDFVHSEDPKFKGKSKKERMKMALGAYYGMHPEKSRKRIDEMDAAAEWDRDTKFKQNRIDSIKNGGYATSNNPDGSSTTTRYGGTNSSSDSVKRPKSEVQTYKGDW